MLIDSLLTELLQDLLCADCVNVNDTYASRTARITSANCSNTRQTMHRVLISGRVNNYHGTYFLFNLGRRLEHEGGDSRCYRLISALVLTVSLRIRIERRQVYDAEAEVCPPLACNFQIPDVMDYCKYCGGRWKTNAVSWTRLFYSPAFFPRLGDIIHSHCTVLSLNTMESLLHEPILLGVRSISSNVITDPVVFILN